MVPLPSLFIPFSMPSYMQFPLFVLKSKNPSDHCLERDHPEIVDCLRFRITRVSRNIRARFLFRIHSSLFGPKLKSILYFWVTGIRDLKTLWRVLVISNGFNFLLEDLQVASSREKVEDPTGKEERGTDSPVSAWSDEKCLFFYLHRWNSSSDQRGNLDEIWADKNWESGCKYHFLSQLQLPRVSPRRVRIFCPVWFANLAPFFVGQIFVWPKNHRSRDQKRSGIDGALLGNRQV